MPTQNVNLTSELEGFVKSQVEGGFFNNASEVHRAALSGMARREEERQARIERLKAEAERGWQEIEAGRCEVIESAEDLEKMMDDSLGRVRQRLEQSNAEPLL